MIKRSDIKYRVGSFKETDTKSFATFLIYIDARTACDGLDEKYGEDGWEFNWKLVDGHTYAIRGEMKAYTDVGERIRSDVGYPQSAKVKKGVNDTEMLKDAISDALKRCAVQFGVGRELYSAPFLYTEEINTFGTKGSLKINSYKPLNQTGKQMIEGNIDKWHKELTKS